MRKVARALLNGSRARVYCRLQCVGTTSATLANRQHQRGSMNIATTFSPVILALIS